MRIDNLFNLWTIFLRRGYVSKVRVSLFRFRPYENLQTKLYQEKRMIFSTSKPYLLINMFIYKQWTKHGRTQSLNLLVSIINDGIYLTVLGSQESGEDGWFSDSEWSVPLKDGRF